MVVRLDIGVANDDAVADSHEAVLSACFAVDGALLVPTASLVQQYSGYCFRCSFYLVFLHGVGKP